MDELLESLQQIDPLWSVVLVAIALAILVIARVWGASLLKAVAVFVAVFAVGGVAAAGYYGYLHLEDSRRIEERRVLEERAAALFSRAVEPESVFACIDGSPVPAMQEGCERILFAEPQRVAAAVAIVTQRLAFLDEALAFAERDPSYLERIEPIRKSAESDPYGFVAFVLSVEHQCTADSCKRFSMLRDATTVKENMRVRRLEAYMAKYSAGWRGAAADEAGGAAAAPKPTTAPLVSISEPAPAPEPAAAPAAAAGASVSVEPSPASEPAEKPAEAAPAAPQMPIAAQLPLIAPPSETTGFGDSPRPAAAAPAAAAAKQPAEGAPAAKRPPQQPAQPQAQPRAASQAKAKAADPVSRRTNEPVAGLPRVVPSEYIRDKEEKEETETSTQAEGRPGAPTPIIPQQNFR
ncbi:MAG: hypothetical protein IT539_10750 [Bradyrhizobiaceae bacterium]|nr:hypothetical protein [Bradyrhizobiaceae bacterium]